LQQNQKDFDRTLRRSRVSEKRILIVWTLSSDPW